MFADAEIGRVQLEHLRLVHHLLERIEILVVENARIVVRSGIENPLALGMQIGLHRLAFDFFSDRVLFAVGVRHVVMIEREQAAAQQKRRRQAPAPPAGTG